MALKPDIRLIILLTFIGTLTIVLGYSQIKKTIYSPFKISEQATTEMPTQEEVLAILDQQDTDNDGLSDFDEKFIYQTSVYIDDTDSDGFTDKEEVEAKSDPLDPKFTPYHISEQTGQNVLEQNLSSEDDVSDEEISIQEIKDLLIDKAGLSKEIVDKLDDKTIRELYNETKQETGIDLNKLEAPADQQHQFSDLTAEEIRQLLIAQGGDETMLNSIDDETLRIMFLQSLESSGL